MSPVPAGKQGKPVTTANIRIDTALGNRILANEGVLDAFGHVSMRHPANPNRYFLSRSRAPELVEPADILEYDLDSNPVKPTDQRLYAERVIHGEHLEEERQGAAKGAPAIANMWTLTLSCDHRVIDGAVGARFLKALVHAIETAAGVAG